MTELMKPADVAERLQVSLRKVYKLIEDGELVATHIGERSVRVPRANLEQYIANATR